MAIKLLIVVSLICKLVSRNTTVDNNTVIISGRVGRRYSYVASIRLVGLDLTDSVVL